MPDFASSFVNALTCLVNSKDTEFRKIILHDRKLIKII